MHRSRTLPSATCLPLLLLAGVAAWAHGAVEPAPLFGDGMVLQRDAPVRIWGKADRGEHVAVAFRGQRAEAVADDKGAWMAQLPAMAAGGPWPLTITGSTAITYAQVWVGDVWICSGQSNMVQMVKECSTKDEAAADRTEELRITNGTGPWAAAAGTELRDFSAVAYYFGKQLHATQKIPIGLVSRGVSATCIQFWLPPKDLHALWEPRMNGERWEVLEPALHLASKGVIWYQGESNAFDESCAWYSCLFKRFIENVRAAAGRPDLPFLFVQLPRFGEAGLRSPDPANGWAILRREQARVLSMVPHTAMSVYFDATDGNLHPWNKQIAGERLALVARHVVYGEQPAGRFLSPQLAKAERTGTTAKLTFVNAADGLVAKESADGIVQDLYLIGADGVATAAKSRIEGGTLVVDLGGAKDLPDIAYATGSWPKGNLFNTAGLPAAPFWLHRPRIALQDYHDRTIILSWDGWVDPAEFTADPAAFTIAGRTIAKVTVPNHIINGVELTIDRPLATGEQVTVEFPGFKQWDGVTPLPALTFRVEDSKPANGGLFREYLIGDLRHWKAEGINDGAFKGIEVDPNLRPQAGGDWTIAGTDTGLVDFKARFGDEKNVIAFAHVYIHAEQAGSYQIWVGADKMAQVFVNGASIFKERGASLPVRPDQIRVKDVKLQQGWNSLMIEVVQAWFGDWSVGARIMGNDGRPPVGIRYQAAKPAGL